MRCATQLVNTTLAFQILWHFKSIFKFEFDSDLFPILILNKYSLLHLSLYFFSLSLFPEIGP
jgi:hypothetical protein